MLGEVYWKRPMCKVLIYKAVALKVGSIKWSQGARGFIFIFLFETKTRIIKFVIFRGPSTRVNSELISSICGKKKNRKICVFKAYYLKNVNNLPKGNTDGVWWNLFYSWRGPSLRTTDIKELTIKVNLYTALFPKKSV